MSNQRRAQLYGCIAQLDNLKFITVEWFQNGSIIKNDITPLTTNAHSIWGDDNKTPTIEKFTMVTFYGYSYWLETETRTNLCSSLVHLEFNEVFRSLRAKQRKK